MNIYVYILVCTILSTRMVDVFGEDGGRRLELPPLSVCEKVEKKGGIFKNYIKKIQKSYQLGFTPYRNHLKHGAIYVNPLHVYNEHVFALDDTGAFDVTLQKVDNDNTLFYWEHDETVNGGIVSALVHSVPRGGK